ncbi:6-carboxyhexanoate--CoA ligase [Domibacillus tundrae]|uniref:6-carboxyhexanoate--CoA ligase n=1 Tax=Domibacillus tundrae TaxID=1587527 RepID=UPI000A86BDFB
MTGYVSCFEKGYVRIPHLKEKGDFNGGRVFFVSEDIEINQLFHFSEQKSVLLV